MNKEILEKDIAVNKKVLSDNKVSPKIESKKDLVKSEKVPTKKMNGKFVVSDEVKIQKLEDFLKNLNDKKFGRKVNWADVIYHFVENYGDKELESIQESVMTKQDRVLKKISELNNKNDNNLDVFDIAAKHLKIQ